jgi:aspartate aminotransferase-like enzyme
MEGAARCGIRRRALCAVNGAFGERWLRIIRACGKQVDVLEAPWGKAIKPDMVRKRLEAGDYDAFAIVHNETSTGVRNPMEEIARVLVDYPDVTFMVDSISGLGGDKLDIDRLGIDIIFTSSQKCFATPPGLAIGVISDEALERARTIPNRGYYADFVTILDYYERKGQTPTTPAVSLLYALDQQVQRMLAEGADRIYARHLAMAKWTRTWANRWFEMFPERGYESVTVSAVRNTRKVNIPRLIWMLAERGYLIANGYGKLRDKTFRIGHMGNWTLTDVKRLLANINDILGLG